AVAGAVGVAVAERTGCCRAHGLFAWTTRAFGEVPCSRRWRAGPRGDAVTGRGNIGTPDAFGGVMATSVDRASVGLRSARGPVLGSLMLATGLIAIDATILATAVPSIVRDLGGYQQFLWLFSVYLLAQAVSVPIYSRFADTIGRKPIIMIGIALFLLGSVLCGLAGSMMWLILFRIVQGLGAGAVAPMSMTIVGDIYTVAE